MAGRPGGAGLAIRGRSHPVLNIYASAPAYGISYDERRGDTCTCTTAS